MKKTISFFILTALIFQSSPVLSAAKVAEPVKLRVGYFSNITHAQALIGHANQWFDQNLEPQARIDWKIFNAGPSAVEALFANQLDIAYIGPSPAVNAYVKSEGEAVRIIAGASSGGAALLVRTGAGIKKIEDFHGKKIASPQLGNTQDVALRSWLLKNGLKLKEVGGDVQVLPVPNADQITLFLKNDIDASWSVEPWVSILENKKEAEVFLEESSLWEGGKYSTAVVLARAKFLEQHPELVKRFLETHVKITNWIHSNPAEAKAVFKKEFEKETGREFSQEILDAAWKRVEFSQEPFESTIRAQALAAYRVGFLKKEPDLRFLFDTRLLKEVTSGKVETTSQK